MTEETTQEPAREEEEPVVEPISDRQRTVQTVAGLLLIVGGWSGFFIILPAEGADPSLHRFFAAACLVLGGIFVNKKATEEWVISLLRRIFPGR